MHLWYKCWPRLPMSFNERLFPSVLTQDGPSIRDGFECICGVNVKHVVPCRVIEEMIRLNESSTAVRGHQMGNFRRHREAVSH